MEQISSFRGGSLFDCRNSPWLGDREKLPRSRPCITEVNVNCILVPDVFFDDKATLATGTVFDPTCRSARHFARAERVRAHIAKRIIEAAKNGERDPIRLHSHASTEFSIDDVSVPVVRVARDVPVPVYALIARTA